MPSAARCGESCMTRSARRSPSPGTGCRRPARPRPRSRRRRRAFAGASAAVGDAIEKCADLTSPPAPCARRTRARGRDLQVLRGDAASGHGRCLAPGAASRCDGGRRLPDPVEPHQRGTARARGRRACVARRHHQRVEHRRSPTTGAASAVVHSRSRRHLDPGTHRGTRWNRARELAAWRRAGQLPASLARDPVP